MRQGQNNNKNRMRGRNNNNNNNRKGGGSRNNSYESNGPDVKVRGNAQQVVEKYLTLARDATLSGDRIDAESYYQFAEHYYRIMNANAVNEQQREQQNAPNDQQGGDNAQKAQNGGQNPSQGSNQAASGDENSIGEKREQNMGTAKLAGDVESAEPVSEAVTPVENSDANIDDVGTEAGQPRRRSSRGGSRRQKQPAETASAEKTSVEKEQPHVSADEVSALDAAVGKPSAKRAATDASKDSEEGASA